MLFAAGTHAAAGELLHRGEPATAWLVAGGAGAFLLGSAGFRGALRFANPLWRAVAAPVCLLTPPIGTRLSVAVDLVVLAVLLVAPTLVDRPTAALDD
jgi:hypothetical protein